MLLNKLNLVFGYAKVKVTCPANATRPNYKRGIKNLNPSLKNQSFCVCIYYLCTLCGLRLNSKRVLINL